MDAGNDSAGVVKGSSLLHIVIVGNGKISSHSILLLPEELSVDDDGKDGLGHESE